MPVGYSARCKVCNSPRRAEVEKWVKEEGISVREAARRLAEHGEKISHEAIRKHMIEHFDIKAEAREQYQRSKEQMQQLVEKRVSDIEMLDEIARGSFELNKAARAWLQELVQERNKKIPKALVDLISTTAAEVRQHLKAKQELLGGDPANDIADALRTLWGDDDVDDKAKAAPD